MGKREWRRLLLGGSLGGFLVRAAAAAFLLYLLSIALWTDDEAAIRRALDGLAEAASMAGEEPLVERLGRSNRVASFFTSDCSIVLQPSGWYPDRMEGRQEIQQAVLAARGQGKHVDFAFSGIRVEVAPDGRIARVPCRAVAAFPREGDADSRDLVFTFRREGASWRISRVEPAPSGPP